MGGGAPHAGTEVAGVYLTAGRFPASYEPCGVVADCGNGVVRVWAGGPWPGHTRRAVAACLGVEEERVVVEPLLGPGMEGMFWYPSALACRAAWEARAAGRPVRVMADRRDAPALAPCRVGLRSVVDGEGEVRETAAEVTVTLGGWGAPVEEIVSRAALGALGAYRLGAVTLEAEARVDGGAKAPLADLGLAQGCFAVERHVTALARARREDPAGWRKRHALVRGERLAVGTALTEDPPIPALIDRAAAMGDYWRRWASYETLREGARRDGARRERRRGIGVACGFQGTGLLYPGLGGEAGGAAGIRMTLDKDGSLEIRAAAAPPSSRVLSIWKKTAEEVLGVEAAKVRFVNTGEGLIDPGPAALSRNLVVVTRLVERCCVAIRKQRFRDPLPITVTRTTRPGRFSPWDGAAPPADPEAFARPGWAAAVVEVAIDPVALGPVLRGVSLVVDAGRVLSPEGARQALRLATLRALDWASGGEIAAANAAAAADAAGVITIDFVKSAAAPRGIGTLPFTCVPAAYAEAVSQAADHCFDALPLGAAEIWEAWSREISEGLGDVSPLAGSVGADAVEDRPGSRGLEPGGALAGGALAAPGSLS